MNSIRSFAWLGRAVLTGLFLVFATPTQATTITITADPSCLELLGICNLLPLDTPINSVLDSSNPLVEVDIGFSGSRHVRAEDSDAAEEHLFVQWLGENLDSPTARTLFVEVGFSDENGNIITPNSPLPILSALLEAGGSRRFSLPINFNLQDFFQTPFIFHDVHLTFTTDATEVRLDTLSLQLSALDPGSRVGSWPVPEPATLTLFGAGLVGLGWMRRRRRSPA